MTVLQAILWIILCLFFGIGVGSFWTNCTPNKLSGYAKGLFSALTIVVFYMLFMKAF